MCKILIFATLILCVNSLPADDRNLSATPRPSNRGNARFQLPENVHLKRQTPFYFRQTYEAPVAVKVAPVSEEQAPPTYQFHYKVEDERSGDFKYHTESRNGDVVRGEYGFKEADGTVRTVKYVVEGKSGFNAVIIKSGRANNHPQVQVNNGENNGEQSAREHDYYRRYS